MGVAKEGFMEEKNKIQIEVTHEVLKGTYAKLNLARSRKWLNPLCSENLYSAFGFSRERMTSFKKRADSAPSRTR